MPGDENTTNSTSTSATAEDKAAAKAAKAAEARSDAIDAMLASWVGNHLNNSPVSQDQRAYNHVLQVLPALRDLILKSGE